MKIKNLILIAIFLLQSCGYSPIYSNIKKIDFNLNLTEILGDNEMNNIVATKIKKYSKNISKKTYDLKVITNYQKVILSKNKKGEVTNYLIKKEVIFEIINPEIKNKFIFNDEIQAKNIDNQFEFKKYENSIKNNFIDSKVEEFIYKLSNF
tara:strand:- start:1168 stop:1620 length:453 start_codon:yes stop_codon:yes gene_type:complete